MARRGLPSRRLTFGFFIADFPAVHVGLDHRLHVVPKRLTDLQDCPQVVPTRPCDSATLVGSAGDLVEVSANGAQLSHGLFQGNKLALREWCELIALKQSVAELGAI